MTAPPAGRTPEKCPYGCSAGPSMKCSCVEMAGGVCVCGCHHDPKYAATAGSEGKEPCGNGDGLYVCKKPKWHVEDCVGEKITPPVREARRNEHRDWPCGCSMSCGKDMPITIPEACPLHGKQDATLAAKYAEIRSLREELEAAQEVVGSQDRTITNYDNLLAKTNDKAAALEEALKEIVEYGVHVKAIGKRPCDCDACQIVRIAGTALAPPNAAAREGRGHLAGCRCPECDPAYNDPRNDEAPE